MMDYTILERSMLKAKHFLGLIYLLFFLNGRFDLEKDGFV